MKKTIALTLLTLSIMSCSNTSTVPQLGNYAYDVELFKRCGIDAIDLSSPDGASRILVVPAYQGRVMTSTADGLGGVSSGWINHSYIEKGEVAKHMHAVGGEERFWIGPEGGPNAYYFPTVDDQTMANWQVPAFIDTDEYAITAQSKSMLVFEKSASLKNAQGNPFEMKVVRTIELLDKRAIESSFSIEGIDGVKCVGYEVTNELFNIGQESWSKETGIPSIWSLSMINSTPRTTIVVPYREDVKDAIPIYNDGYFGEIAPDRIQAKEGIVYFKADATQRRKLGISYDRAVNLLGSYAPENNQLTVIWYTLPEEKCEYVNSVWGNDTPYVGDVVNAYNDGPNDDGSQFGVFYELETSSPAVPLASGESIVHRVKLVHFVGDEECLGKLSTKIFGVDVRTIAEALQ